MPDKELNHITTQFHEIYNNKESIWKQINDSYSGGVVYRNADYLHKYTIRESVDSYEERKKRAVFINNVQPLSDMLVGFLFGNEVVRTDYKQDYVLEKTSLHLGLNSFMQKVALNSLLYTTGILIDSPKFDTSIIKTENDRKAHNLYPYAVVYDPSKIRNFHHNSLGELEWILLDNSYYDTADPFLQAKYKTVFRLWTKEFYQDFTAGSIKGNKLGKFTASKEVPHGLGEVPFIFANWRDRNNTYFADTIFEDIALFDQAIYNYMSLMDENLAGGTFKFLFYPDEVPKSIKSQGFSNLACLPFPGDGAAPFFAGPELNELEPFLSAMNFLLTGILRKLGLNTDQEKNYVQSGQAKFFDFTKTKALLVSGAQNMQEIEKEIFRIFGLWMRVEDDDAKIEYKKDFLGEEEQIELTRLYQMMTLPYDKLRQESAKRIATINMGDVLSNEELEEIEEEISDPEGEEIDIDELKLKQGEQSNESTTEN